MENTNSNNLLQSSYDSQDDAVDEEEKRRALQREQLSRRPSYRKILDELASESGSNEQKDSKLGLPGGHQTSSNMSQQQQPTVITVNNNNLSHQQILAGQHVAATNLGAAGLGAMFQTPVIVTSDVMSALAITLTNSSNNTSQPTVVALPQGTNSESLQSLAQPSTTIMSFANNQADIQGLSAQVLSNVVQAPRTALITTPYSYIHRPPNSQVVMTQGMPVNHQTPQQLADEASKKREIRLMKNREAARHCRVKKKEYLKCLEERVQILEGQNKKLIDELKALKEFYIQHKKDYPDQNI